MKVGSHSGLIYSYLSTHFISYISQLNSWIIIFLESITLFSWYKISHHLSLERQYSQLTPHIQIICRRDVGPHVYGIFFLERHMLVRTISSLLNIERNFINYSTSIPLQITILVSGGILLLELIIYSNNDAREWSVDPWGWYKTNLMNTPLKTPP